MGHERRRGYSAVAATVFNSDPAAAACAIMPCRTTSVRELRKAICSILSSSLLCISRRWTVRLRLRVRLERRLRPGLVMAEVEAMSASWSVGSAASSAAAASVGLVARNEEGGTDEEVVAGCGATAVGAVVIMAPHVVGVLEEVLQVDAAGTTIVLMLSRLLAACGSTSTLEEAWQPLAAAAAVAVAPS